MLTKPFEKCGGSVESDTMYGDFMVTLIWRLYDNLSNHVFSIKNLHDLQANVTIKSPKKVSISTLSPW